MAVWIDRVIQRPRLSAVWIRIVEPLLRFWPTYPPDWQLRRMLVFERAHGRCDECGWPVGALRQMDDGWRLVGAHVHHVKSIARGGRHGLPNLRLLCTACHARQHPGNEWLQECVRNDRSSTFMRRRARSRRELRSPSDRRRAEGFRGLPPARTVRSESPPHPARRTVDCAMNDGGEAAV